MIIGVMKGGTSSLFYYLRQHPQIISPLQKELRFFSGHYNGNLQHYRQYFPLKGTIKALSYFQQRDVITGEATPNYFFHPFAASRIAESLPHVRLIVLLRDPADRAYSHYQHLVKRNNLNQTFEEAIEACLNQYPKVLENHFKDPFTDPKALARYSILERGKYINHLRRWWSYFSPGQLKVVTSEALFQNPVGVYQEVVEFLGLSDDENKAFKAKNINHYDPLKSSTRQWLNDFYRPYNQALVQALGHSLPWTSFVADK